MEVNMRLKIDCKSVEVNYSGNDEKCVEVEIYGEHCYTEQLEHYIDYLKQTYGEEFKEAVKSRFNLSEE
jgi:hypothetical protein